MSPINATQTIMTELSEHFCQRSVHRGQMAERAKEEKETDDRKEWGKRRTRWKTGWFGLSLAFHIKLWTQTTHTGTNTVYPHINTGVFTPDSEPNQWLWSNINMVPSIATCGTMEQDWIVLPISLWQSWCMEPNDEANNIPLSLPNPFFLFLWW